MEETTTTTTATAIATNVVVGGDGDRVPKPMERRSKRRKTEAYSPPSRWRTEKEQQIYSSKFFDALRHVRRASPASPTRARAVREAADRALAFAARGRTNWSRAILLSGRRALRLKATRRRPKSPSLPLRPNIGGANNAQDLTAWREAKAVPALERKAKVLGRLVPGCRKLPLPALLDETSDYIAALQMQVRAMTALAEILSSATATTTTTTT